MHGRHRKGGSSSGRFARRREGEARAALQAAADVAVRVLVPAVAIASTPSCSAATAARSTR